ncbi:MAG TPA: DNA polymerase III subunit gamma/tau [Vampirovibrionales bacterium]
MAEPLYLKYRPQKLAELVGQEIVSQTLTNAIQINKVSHAYFFTGPRGCGKTSSARILAKSLNCKEGLTANPCGKCQNCLEIAQGISPDVIEIDAASHRSVEDAAQVIERCQLAPQTAPHKIYILDEVHMLSKEAFNALLKTIEEPPPNVVFILATTEEHKVPSTIVSRCQRFSFRPIETNALTSRLKEIANLEAIDLEEEAYSRIVRHSKGGLRDALTVLEQVSLLAIPGEAISAESIRNLLGGISEEKLEKLLKSFLLKELEQVFDLVDDLFAEGVDSLLLVRNLLEYAVDELEQKKQEEALRNNLINGIEHLLKLESTLRISTNAQVRLKNSLLSFCINENNSSEVDLSPLLQRIESLESKLSNINANKQIKPSYKEQPKAIRNEENEFKPLNQNLENTQTFINQNKTDHNPSSATTKNTTSTNYSTQTKTVSGNGNQSIINILSVQIKNQPIKAALNASSAFISEETDSSITIGIPKKTFYDKLNQPRKIEVIEETLKEHLGKSLKIKLELVDKVPDSVTALNKVQSFTSSQKPISTNEPSNQVKTPSDDEPSFTSNYQSNTINKSSDKPEFKKEQASFQQSSSNPKKIDVMPEPNPLLMNEEDPALKSAAHILGAFEVKKTD